MVERRHADFRDLSRRLVFDYVEKAEDEPFPRVSIVSVYECDVLFWMVCRSCLLLASMSTDKSIKGGKQPYDLSAFRGKLTISFRPELSHRCARHSCSEDVIIEPVDQAVVSAPEIRSGVTVREVAHMSPLLNAPQLNVAKRDRKAFEFFSEGPLIHFPCVVH